MNKLRAWLADLLRKAADRLTKQPIGGGGAPVEPP